MRSTTVCVPSGDTYGCFHRAGWRPTRAAAPHLRVPRNACRVPPPPPPTRRRRRGHGDGNRPTHGAGSWSWSATITTSMDLRMTAWEDEVRLDGSLGSAEDGGDAERRAFVVEVTDNHLVGLEDEDVHRGDRVEVVDGNAATAASFALRVPVGTANAGEASARRAWISERIAATMGRADAHAVAVADARVHERDGECAVRRIGGVGGGVGGGVVRGGRRDRRETATAMTTAAMDDAGGAAGGGRASVGGRERARERRGRVRREARHGFERRARRRARRGVRDAEVRSVVIR